MSDTASTGMGRVIGGESSSTHCITSPTLKAGMLARFCRKQIKFRPSFG